MKSILNVFFTKIYEQILLTFGWQLEYQFLFSIHPCGYVCGHGHAYVLRHDCACGDDDDGVRGYAGAYALPHACARDRVHFYADAYGHVCVRDRVRVCDWHGHGGCACARGRALPCARDRGCDRGCAPHCGCVCDRVGNGVHGWVPLPPQSAVFSPLLTL